MLKTALRLGIPISLAVCAGLVCGCGGGISHQGSIASKSPAAKQQQQTYDIAFVRQSDGSNGATPPIGMASGNSGLFLTSDGAAPGSESNILDGGDFWGVDISPDGSTLAFTARDTSGNIQLYLMNIGGGNIVQVTTGQEWPEAPRFSSDGSLVLYDRWDYNIGNAQLFEVPVSGSPEVEITSSDLAALYTYGPSLTPDGSRIVFTGFADAPSIYIVNVDGTQLTQLTNGDWATAMDSFPTVSPDGSYVVFARINWSNMPPCDFTYTCGWNLYQVGITGELVGPAASPLTSDNVSGEPRFLDGDILFLGSPDSASSQIVKMNPDGTGRTQITDTPYFQVFTY